jgi:hypothetical protein
MKIRILAYITLLLFCCCNQTSTPVTPIPNFNFTYTPVYDSIITMSANSTYNFDFSINVLTGNINNNRLGCVITGLPASVSVFPATLVVGEVMGGVFTITTGNVPVGTDTLIFSRNCTALGTQKGKLILKIVPPIDYAPRLAGTYDSSYDFCSPSTYRYSAVVTTVPGTPYQLKIGNIKNLGPAFAVTAIVSQVITIPFQTIPGLPGYSIWGSGTYTLISNPLTTSYYEMNINDTLVSGIDTTPCIMHIQPK